MEAQASLTTFKVISVTEAASALGVSKSWVYALAKKGKIKHYRLEGSVKLDAEDFSRYVAENTHEATR